MACPLCEQRKPRRDCPGVGRTICTICCATKRLVEINCPPDCVHLVAAREHPAAIVRRQQERDVATLLPTIKTLTERQHQLFFLFHTAIARHKPEGFSKLSDDDVAQAAAAVAATFETAARGVIYEHTAESVVAQRLASDLRSLLDDMRQHGATVYDREAAIVLRAIEQGARETRTRAEGEVAAYLSLVGRLLQINKVAQSTAKAADEDPGRSIVLP